MGKAQTKINRYGTTTSLKLLVGDVEKSVPITNVLSVYQDEFADVPSIDTNSLKTLKKAQNDEVGNLPHKLISEDATTGKKAAKTPRKKRKVGDKGEDKVE